MKNDSVIVFVIRKSKKVLERSKAALEKSKNSTSL